MISLTLGGVMVAYLGAGLLFLLGGLGDSPRWTKSARGLLGAGLAVHSLALLGRWVETLRLASAQAPPAAGVLEWLRLAILHVPLANFYESLVFFAWCLPFLALTTFRRFLKPYLGLLMAWLACLLLAYASLRVDSSIKPLLPALKSNWLLIHVVTAFLGYAAFALGGGAGLLYLGQARRPGARLADLPGLDRLIYQATVVGFLFLTLGILTGAVWAESAWGRYWSWDPKETWSLITWLIYAALLHARLVRGWQGRRLAWLAVAGFLAVLFTYFGVSFLLPGLHSYLT